jgi:hypothetical protein
MAAVLAVLAGLATIAVGILTNIGTTQPLPGLLRWLQQGSRAWVALGVCGVVFIIATAVLAVPSRNDGTRRTAIQLKMEPKLQPRYDEASSQYRNPRPQICSNTGLVSSTLLAQSRSLTSGCTWLICRRFRGIASTTMKSDR